MNYLDFILAIPLIWAVFRGYTKGFISSVAGLLALLLGIYIAIKFSDQSAQFLLKHYDKDFHTLKILGFVFTFIGIVILVQIIAAITNSLIIAASLGFLNRIAGVIFNSLKMGFILSVILSLLNFFDTDSKFISMKDKKESFFYPRISIIAPKVFPYFKFENKEPKIKKRKNTSDTRLKQV